MALGQILGPSPSEACHQGKAETRLLVDVREGEGVPKQSMKIITDLVNQPFWKDNRNSRFGNSPTTFSRYLGFEVWGLGEGMAENFSPPGSRW